MGNVQESHLVGSADQVRSNKYGVVTSSLGINLASLRSWQHLGLQRIPIQVQPIQIDGRTFVSDRDI